MANSMKCGLGLICERREAQFDQSPTLMPSTHAAVLREPGVRFRLVVVCLLYSHSALGNCTMQSNQTDEQRQAWSLAHAAHASDYHCEEAQRPEVALDGSVSSQAHAPMHPTDKRFMPPVAG